METEIRNIEMKLEAWHRSATVEDSPNQPIILQQSNLPDLETALHLQHIGLIADVEKKFALDA